MKSISCTLNVELYVLYKNNLTTNTLSIGCGEQYPGYKFCDEHDVVYISINYRIGPFGKCPILPCYVTSDNKRNFSGPKTQTASHIFIWVVEECDCDQKEKCYSPLEY